MYSRDMPKFRKNSVSQPAAPDRKLQENAARCLELATHLRDAMRAYLLQFNQNPSRLLRRN
jgi:hypothetical protein